MICVLIFHVLYPSLPSLLLNSNITTHLLKWVFICNVIHQNRPIRHSVIYWAQGMKSFLTCCVPYRQVDFLPTKVDFLIHKGCLKYMVKMVNPECFFYELQAQMFIQTTGSWFKKKNIRNHRKNLNNERI